jgi:uncharacterized protein YcbX
MFDRVNEQADQQEALLLGETPTDSVLARHLCIFIDWGYNRSMAYVANLGVHPVKTLDRVNVEEARITESGRLEYDRRYAFVESDEELIKGLRHDELTRLDSTFDLESESLSVQTSEEEQRFHLQENVEEAEQWFSGYLGTEVTIERDPEAGFVARSDAGPSVISTATLEEVASWFDDITAAEIRRRMRVNIEIGGVPPFWEDRFVGESAPLFEINGVRFTGIEPCSRCVIPLRDPESGEITPGFQNTFLENRKRTFPEWADSDVFDNYFYLMLIADVLEEDRGTPIRVGDTVTLIEDSG